VFDYSRGLALETVDGGLLEDVTITNITMRDITNAPIFIRLGARMRAPDSLTVGACRRIIISNVVVYNADYRHGCIISGLQGHDIEDLQLSNIRIYYKGGGPKDSINRVVPEYEKDYPEPYRWRIMPSYGFYIRHVKNLRMYDIQTSFMKDEPRPVFILDDVKNAVLRDLKLQKVSGAAYFMMKSVKDIRIFNSEGMKDVSVKEGDKTISQ
jgi:hypothetical protein